MEVLDKNGLDYFWDKIKSYIDEQTKNVMNKTVLYNNPNGAAGNITLNDNLSNYDYIEIYYENPTFNMWGSSKIDNPNGKFMSLTVGMRYDVTGSYYTYFRDITLANARIDNLYGGYFAVRVDGSIEFFNTGNYISITKVIGYKEKQ